MALLITLFLISIVSLILVAVVSRTRLDHQASANYTKSIRAEEIGMAGLEMVISQLRQELSKDKLPDLTYSSRPLYTNVSIANLGPQPLGTNSAMPNLVKISTNAPFFTGARTKGTLLASTVGTATASLNGRVVDTNRWSAPYLGTFPSQKALPSWVLMTRGGPSSGAAAVFDAAGGGSGGGINDPTIGNTNFAIGRFAYAVYDTSGLLDATVAGYPTSLITPIQALALKGTLAGADVAALGIDAKKFTAWRNAASAASATSYLSYVTNFAVTNGFRTVTNGDTTFLNRQDLIKAAKAGTAGLTTSALTNLTVFSRERNTPSWLPQNPPGGAVVPSPNYASQALTTASANVFVPLIRRTTAATLTNYTVAGKAVPYKVVPGDPLVSYRFPLDRIRWITSTGPAAGITDDMIQTCFGLKWDGARGIWKYYGSTLPLTASTSEQSAISTLAQVAAESKPREANFFELLQAGILSGSLASELHLTKGAAFNGFNSYTFHETSAPLHLFRIGASILTQYQPDGCPVVIEFAPVNIKIGATTYPNLAGKTAIPWQAVGIANLPYINMTSILGGQSPDASTDMAMYMVFGLWNPHQGSGALGTANRPPVRLRVKGAIGAADLYGGYPSGYGLITVSTSVNAGKIPGFTHAIDATLNLTTGVAGAGVNGFADPHALLPTDIGTTPTASTSAGSSWATFAAPGNVNYAGYRIPDFKLSPTYTSDNFSGITGYGSFSGTMWTLFNTDPTNNPFNIWLEYQNPNGVWVPYNYLCGINDPTTWMSKSPGFGCGGLGRVTAGSVATPIPLSSTTVADPGFNYYGHVFWETPDPRSLRYNFTQSQPNGSSIWPTHMNGSCWSSTTDAGNQTLGWIGSQIIQSAFSQTSPSAPAGPWVPASLSRNSNQAGFTPGSSTSPAAYKDPDGIARIADSGAFGTATPNVGNGWQGDPYALSTTRTTDRPVILNRPFAGVGELGYVNRDYPWRTLDLFTANSADAGLLDLFTVSQSTDTAVRGRINPNHASAPVIEAILRNTISSVAATNTLAKPSNIGASLASFSANTANTMLGRDQIATKFVPSLAAANFSGTDEQNVKALREGVTRSLADVSQTRTWNLLVDVVAQAGFYPKTAKGLDQFLVEGERRFWLHIAIDRYTGEVIDQQLERVNQ